MSALMKWSRFRDLDDLPNRLSSFFGRPLLPAIGGEAFENAEWAPSVDVSEDEKEYLLKAELPDIKKEDLKVTVDNGTLRIVGERKFEKETKGVKYHRIERAYGSFERSFAIPEDTNADNMTAEYKDGILHVHLAKIAQPKPKAVEVKVD